MVVPTMGSTGKAAKGAMPMTRRALVSRVPSPATCRMSCDNNLASEKGDSPLFARMILRHFAKFDFNVKVAFVSSCFHSMSLTQVT